jgi:hypothetical protein
MKLQGLHHESRVRVRSTTSPGHRTTPNILAGVLAWSSPALT